MDNRAPVLLPVLRWLLLPALGELAGLNLLVLVPAVALPRHRHDRGIDHLAAARDVALGF